MRIEMTFDRQKVERQGWTMEAVQETVRKNFEARACGVSRRETPSP